MKIHGIILAAGMSKRMGNFKPLLPMGEKTMLEKSLDSMLDAGVERITLVLGFQAEKIEQRLKQSGYDKGKINITYNRKYETTQMLDSVKIGLLELGACDAFYLLPGDMPAIHPSTFIRVRLAMEEKNAKVVFPTLGGYRKHPPLISSDCIPKILSFDKEGGLRCFWGELEEEIDMVPVDDLGCSMDVDTKIEYQNVRYYLEEQCSL